MPSSLPRPTRLEQLIAIGLGLLVVLIAGAVLFGWAFAIDGLKTGWPGGAQMKPNTATGLAVGGVSLVLAALPIRAGAIQRALGLMVSVFGALFMLEYASGRDLGVDNLLFSDASEFMPGRPSVSTSLSFIAVGLALTLIRERGRIQQSIRSILALGGVVLALTAVLGYFVTPIDSSIHRLLFGFAFHTALCFLFLSLGVVAVGARNKGADRFLQFGPPLVGLAALSVLVGASLFYVEAQNASQERASRVLAVQNDLSVLLGLLQDAETGQRGYLLTGVDHYLQPYDAALIKLQALRRRMSEDAARNKSLDESLQRLSPLVDAKLDELRQTITLRRSGGMAEALAIVRTDAGNEATDRLRSEIATIKDRESRQLEKLQNAARRQGALLQISTLLTVALIAALAVFLLLEARRRFNELQFMQRQLRFANANLDLKVREKTSELAEAVVAARRAEQQVRRLNSSLEQQVAERALELERIFAMSSDILGVAGFDGCFKRLSPAFERIIGVEAEQALDLPLIDWVHPDDRAATQRALMAIRAGKPPANLLNRFRRADDVARWLSWSVTPVPDEQLFYFVARDVTVEHELENQLRQAQKMEAVGQLTGGIAHDFNNLLTVVIGNLDMALRGLAEDVAPRARRQIGSAQEGAKKAASLTSRLLAFSRRQPLNPAPVEVNRLVAGMSELLRRTLGEHIAVETVLAGGLWLTSVDANQLESAVLNLAINARDAMPKGGKLTVETANAHLDELYVAAQPEATSGQYVMVAITDTGVGIDPAVLGRVFEPFFTTKPTGLGTGLGLSQVYGFIKQSGGHVSIYSELGHGTTIKIYLPRLNAGQSRDARIESAQVIDDSARGETILLVEDEDEVRKFAVEALEEVGYRVHAAASGVEALSLLEAKPEIALMVSDVVLGGAMNGRQLADEALRRRPDLPILFITGYTRNAIIHHGRLDEGVNLLSKPFTAGVLTQKIRRLLDEGKLKA